MPNPARPQFGDVIDETWGRLSADRIVRRYATPIERDLDLIGFTGADLAGQFVVIVPGGGVKPYLQGHDGLSWQTIIPAHPLLQSGSSFGATYGPGLRDIAFDRPFGPGVPYAAVTSIRTTTNAGPNDGWRVQPTEGSTSTHLQVAVMDAAGVRVGVGTNCIVSYVAMVTTAWPWSIGDAPSAEGGDAEALPA